MSGPNATSQTQSMPNCPNCGADELYFRLTTPDIPAKLDYMQCGIGCYACQYTHDLPPRWVRDEDGSYLIRVAESLQDTLLGRTLGLQTLPLEIRKAHARWYVVEELRAGPYRWWRYRGTGGVL